MQKSVMQKSHILKLRTKLILPLLMLATFLAFAMGGGEAASPGSLNDVMVGSLFFSLASALILWAGRLAAKARF